MKAREARTVLIIEDEADVLSFSSRVLELEGYRVLKAMDPDAGLQEAEREGISLILLDLKLPGRDEWYLLEHLKAEPRLKKIPVIVFTAAAAASQREKALTMGAAQYIVKPVSASTLKDAVAKVLQEAG